MDELLRNAWNGWHSYTETGKLAALLLISLMLLWLYYKRVDRKNFLIYTTVAAGCCIVPVTAAGLMVYQTRFYDYEWIWSMVPLTAMVSFAVTLFVTEFLRDLTRGDKRKRAGVIIMLLAAGLLCGGMGSKPWDMTKEREERQAAETLLTRLREHMGGREICLWAPREVLEYVREYDAGIRLLYGRNMWELSMNAYSYDVYPEELTEVYEWMEGIGREPISAERCAEIVGETGVNCVLLPGTAGVEDIEQFQEIMAMQAEMLGDYYLLSR